MQFWCEDRRKDCDRRCGSGRKDCERRDVMKVESAARLEGLPAGVELEPEVTRTGFGSTIRIDSEGLCGNVPVGKTYWK